MPPPLRTIHPRRDRWPGGYPFDLPAFREWNGLDLRANVTFFAGENGAGKSTLLEGVARALDYPLEGGSPNMRFAPHAAHDAADRLASALRLGWTAARLHGGFFLRAESLHHVASYLDEIAQDDDRALRAYGGRSLHQQSHGESFLATIQHRCQAPGVYLFDEPEAALSPARQLTLLAELHTLARRPGRQFLIATHSPILLALPGAVIFNFSAAGIAEVLYEQTSSYQVMHDFLANPHRMLRELLE